MRIGVIGAGAIGGAIAAIFDRAGHDVEVTARGAGLDAIRSDGLRLDGAWGDHLAHVTADRRLSRTPDLAFVCTKAQDAPAAITENRAFLTGTRVVIVQNGLEALDVADELLPSSDHVGALALYATQYVEPGHVTVTAAGATFIGAGSGPAGRIAQEIATTLDAVMPAVAADNFVGCQWSKLVINMVNAVPAATGISVQQTIRDRALGRIVTRAMRETVRTGIAAGVRFGSLQGLTDALLRFFSHAPLPVGVALPKLMARRMGATPNLGSTLQSIRRGQQTEIDYLSGAVVAAAGENGRRAPVNATLVAAVHEVERTGVFLTREALLAAVDRGAGARDHPGDAT